MQKTKNRKKEKDKNMSHALVIAEKPSLMEEIQKVYNAHRDQIPFTADFVSQRGHLIALKLPREVDPSQRGRSWDNLPYVPEEHGGWQYKVIQEKKTGKYMTSEERYDIIKNKLDSGNYEFVIHAGDPDQEGELLVREVLSFAKNRLPVKRFWTNDLTEQHILHALQNLKDDENDPMLTNLLAAAYGRQHSDYRFGMNISEAASLKMQGNIACGRVMTPILAIVCKREDEIEHFKPKTVYGVKAVYTEGFEGTLFNQQSVSQDENADEDQKQGTVWFETKKEAEDLIRSLPKQATVVSYEGKRTETYAPKLYKLSTIQTDAGHQYGYSADQVLQICQSLYEKKLQSYPRTDCEFLSSQEDFYGILKAANAAEELNPYIKTINRSAIERVKHDKRWINDKKLEDSGHSALRPTTTVPDLSTLTRDERNIYLMVAKRFVAMFLPPLVQDKATLITDAGGSTFKSNGKTLVDPGYTKIFATKFTDMQIPSKNKGDVLDVKTFQLTEKTSTCPKRYTSADLIAACENPLKYLQDERLKKLGKNLKIGTPATRAGIIRKLITIKYMQESKKGKMTYIVPTPNGRAIIRNLGDLMICRVDMTGQWEEELEKVRQGEETLKQLDDGMKKAVADMVEEIRRSEVKAQITGDLRTREYYSCTWQDKPASFHREWGHHRFTDEECEALVSGQQITIDAQNRDGDKCRVKGHLGMQQGRDGKQYLGFVMDDFQNLNPDKMRIPCEWNGQQRSFAPVWGGHRFTEEEKEKLKNKETIQFHAANKAGDDCLVTGALAEYEYKGKQVFGFQMKEFQNLNPAKEKVSGNWDGREVSFKRIWGGYRFTDEEVQKLLNGETVAFQMKNKDGDICDVTGRLADLVYNGQKYVGFDKLTFVNTNPEKQRKEEDYYTGIFKKKEIRFHRVFGGYRFTDEECQRLLAGEEIEVHDLQGKKGPYSAKGKLERSTYKGNKFYGFKISEFLH